MKTRFTTLFLSVFAVVGLVLVVHTVGPASANHVTFLDRFTFVKYMDQSQVVGTNPPGAIRAERVCTDGLNANAGAKTGLRTAAGDWNVAAGFQAFWLYGSGEFFGACNGSEQVQAYWTTTSGCGGSWVGCAQPTSSDAAGGINTAAISLNSSYTYSADGIRAVATHELGHLFSLWEQYVDDGSFACNSNVTSIMESVTLSSGVVVSVCGQIQTQPFDYTTRFNRRSRCRSGRRRRLRYSG